MLATVGPAALAFGPHPDQHDPAQAANCRYSNLGDVGGGSVDRPRPRGAKRRAVFEGKLNPSWGCR